MTEASSAVVLGPPKRWELAFYAFVRGVVVAFCRLFWRLEMHGREHVPPTGPFVLAPVHRSNIDFALVAALTRRRMRCMGKDSIWKSKLLGRFVALLGAFPVHRGAADREAMRTVVATLGYGEPVVIFPEGTRRSGPVVEDLFDGPAYVAVRAGVPIVPVGIGGSERAMPKGSKLPKPVKVVLIVGEPLAPPPATEAGRVSRRAVRELTDELRLAVQKLFDEAQVRAGSPN
ncbi:MAG: lysophospholipid acyltransferase family protein [Acidimicrobiales bacterium]